MNRYELPPCSASHCLITISPGLAAARDLLRKQRFSVVACERDLLPGSWRDFLEFILKIPEPPALIVTSRLADDYLWAEALNLGAYDVLAKPFDPAEVMRTLGLAGCIGQAVRKSTAHTRNNGWRQPVDSPRDCRSVQSVLDPGVLSAGARSENS